MGVGISFNDGDDVVLKGATDGTLIGNTGSRLDTTAVISSITATVTGSLSPNFRIDQVGAISLVTGSYTTIYNYTGSGYIVGYSCEFNNAAILFRMQIDGQSVITNTSLTTLGGYQVTSNSTDRRQAGSGIVVNGANIDFSTRPPIRFTTSINLAADANGGAALSHSLSQALIYIVKDT